MKPLKIRAWDKELKEMKVWDFRDVWESELMPDFDDYDLMQFTGLLDKEGKEIYEGDIVDCKTYSRWGCILEVDDMIDWRQQLTYEFDGKSEQPEDLEVIGNIYENPELINRQMPK